MGKARKRGPVRVREAIRAVESDGWYQIQGGQTSGDHRQYKHPVKTGKVTIKGKLSLELGDDLEDSIRKQAGLTKQEWEKLLD